MVAFCSLRCGWAGAALLYAAVIAGQFGAARSLHAQTVQTSPAPASVIDLPQASIWRAALGKAALEEIPKLFTAAFVAFLAWLITIRITAQWDLRKKRNEFDLILVKEFYDLIGRFKSLARDAEQLGVRQPADAPSTPSPAMAAWDERHAALCRAATEIEMRMEAILLKLVSELPFETGLSPDLRSKRIHAAGLLRVAFRRLRERIEDWDGSAKLKLPGFDSPESWLFSRLAGELSQSFALRAAKPPTDPKRRGNPADAADYLQLIAYRTGDLQAAIGRLSPALAALGQARDKARRKARLQNVAAVFDRTRVFIEGVDAPALVHVKPASCIILIADKEVDAVAIEIERQRLLALFEQHGQQVDAHFLVIADRPPRLVIVDQKGMQTQFDASLPLPTDLPRRECVKPPVHAERLIAWALDADARKALSRIATIDLRSG